MRPKHSNNPGQTFFRQPRSLAIISSQAFSLVNFRGVLIRDLIAAGVRVLALAPDFTPELRKQVRDIGAEPVDYALNRTRIEPFYDIFCTLKLARLLAKLRPEATLAYFIKPVIYGTVASRMASVPCRLALIEGAGYVFTEDEGGSAPRRLLRLFVSLLYLLSLNHADRIFVLNRDDWRMFAGKRIAAKKKLVLLPGIGVDLNHFRPAPPVIAPVTFLFAGRLLKEKGICDFVAAARCVKALHPNTRFLVLGGIDANPSSLSEKEVARWVDERLVEWPGMVRDVRSWIEKASVFVLPSYREGLPRSTQEAMAMGRPIITTDVPGCRETVSEGENGYLVPVRNPAALAEAMIRFIEQPELIPIMGAASRRLAENRFDVLRINTNIMNVLNSCFSQKAGVSVE